MQKYLLNFLQIIPKNKVVSYWFLWEIFNLHPRQVANILKNNQKQDIYPCYKVVNTDGSLWWYNLWIDEKIKRLENDWIKIENWKILSDYFWTPKIKNFFVAFPLIWEEKAKFKRMYFELKTISNGSFTLQSFKSPHITLRFFWNIWFWKMYEIISKLENENLLSKNKEVILNKIWNFNDKVWFFTNSNEYEEFKNIYQKFHQITWIEIENRSYHPHLTIVRVKNLNDFPKQKFLDIVSKYSFKIKLDKIRFYAAFDNIFQVPICDL